MKKKELFKLQGRNLKKASRTEFILFWSVTIAGCLMFWALVFSWVKSFWV